MAKRNDMESRIHGAGVEMWKGNFKLFVSPGVRPCRVNIEVMTPVQQASSGVEWMVLEAICRNTGNFA